MFEKEIIDFKSAKVFSDIVIDLFAKEDKLKDFHNNNLPYKEIINTKKQNYTKTDRTTLIAALTKQYKALLHYTNENTDTTNNTIKLLQLENTFTVTTGHQLCFFTGPLYFIYKIITTINLAENLKKQFPENNFIPIYWLASEDHDFEEIASFNIYNKNVKMTPSNTGAVGHLHVTDLENIKNELAILLGNSAVATEITILFETCYNKEKNLSLATTMLVHKLFSSFGLLCIDANDAILKQSMQQIFKDDIENNTAFNLVNNTSEKLEKLTYSKQVSGREINLFYLENGLRARIIKENNDYVLGNKKITKTDVFNLIESNPACISPNVVLRPLYQEKILPNIAYVGGGGEIAYWLQLKSVFDFYKIPFPKLFLRHSVAIVEKSSLNKLKNLQLTTVDLFNSVENINKSIVEKNNTTQIDFTVVKNTLSNIYAQLSENVANVDKSLGPSVLGELKKATDGIGNLENKVLKANKQKFELQINQIQKIRDKFLPNNNLQEREVNVFQFINQHGWSFITALKNNINNTESTFYILYL